MQVKFFWTMKLHQCLQRLLSKEIEENAVAKILIPASTSKTAIIIQTFSNCYKDASYGRHRIGTLGTDTRRKQTKDTHNTKIIVHTHTHTITL